MNRDRKLIFLTVLYFAILGCFLLGCSEGTDSSPVSALMSDISTYESNGSLNKVIGLVLYSSNNEAASKVLVNLKNNNNDTIKSELTNSDGSFSFNSVPNGSYTLEIKSDYIQDPSASLCKVEIKNGITTPEKTFIFLKTDNSNASDTIKVAISGYVKRSDNSSSSDTTVKIFKDANCSEILLDEDGKEFATLVLGDNSFMFFNVLAGKNYFLQASEKNEVLATYPIGISSTGVISPKVINIPIIVKESIATASLNITITSAYTGAPLELATVKINGENQGTTDNNGKITVTDFPIGVCNFEIIKEGFETLTSTKNYTDPGSIDIDFTMIEDTKDGYGSITGRYVDIEGNTSNATELYVRLYRLIERTQTSSLSNKTETWYDVDKKYILTTKTSNGTGTSNEGSFKLTHIEPGTYQIYIGKTADYPDTESRPQVYNDFVWTQLEENANGCLEITQPLKVVSNQTTYWTNYEQGNN